jgi:hypothetical protein
MKTAVVTRLSASARQFELAFGPAHGVRSERIARHYPFRYTRRRGIGRFAPCRPKVLFGGMVPFKAAVSKVAKKW